MFTAIRRLEDIAPTATDAQINFADGHRQNAGTIPLAHMVGLGKGGKDQMARQRCG